MNWREHRGKDVTSLNTISVGFSSRFVTFLFFFRFHVHRLNIRRRPLDRTSSLHRASVDGGRLDWNTRHKMEQYEITKNWAGSSKYRVLTWVLSRGFCKGFSATYNMLVVQHTLSYVWTSRRLEAFYLRVGKGSRGRFFPRICTSTSIESFGSWDRSTAAAVFCWGPEAVPTTGAPTVELVAPVATFEGD